MLIAYSKLENRFLFAGQSPELLSEYAGKKDLYCPYDKSLLVYWRKKSKDGRTAHFGLYPKQTDAETIEYINAMYKGEGKHHINVKYEMLERLYKEHEEAIKNKTCIVQEEHTINDQRADIFIDLDNHKTVIEVQFSAITLHEVQKRTTGWMDKGIDKIHWIMRKSIIDNAISSYLQDMQGVYSTVVMDTRVVKSSIQFEGQV